MGDERGLESFLWDFGGRTEVVEGEIAAIACAVVCQGRLKIDLIFGAIRFVSRQDGSKAARAHPHWGTW